MVDLPDFRRSRILVTGKMANFTRDEIQRFISTHNGIPADQMDLHVDFVVAGERCGPNKIEKARKWGIPIVTPAALWHYGNTGTMPHGRFWDWDESYGTWQRSNSHSVHSVQDQERKLAEESTQLLLEELTKLAQVDFTNGQD